MNSQLNGIYIAYPGEKKHKGLMQKIEAQIDAFEHFGIRFDYFELKINKNFGLIRKILRRLPFLNINPIKFDLNINKEYNIIYIRYFLADWNFLKYLEYERKKNPNVKIVIEFFDWPYERHYQNLKAILLLRKDKIVREYYKNYVNRVITYTNDEEVLGMKTLHTLNRVNGIDVKKIPIREPIKNGVIDLITVSIMKAYHGYERLIVGLGNYYANGGTRDICLHMVGNGPECSKYQRLTEKFKIKDKVKFYGFLFGKDLHDLYNLADIAVASLGMFKLNIEEGSFIKTSEYLAKGLPIITGCKIALFKDNAIKHFYEFPNDSSIIDFSRVVEFYDSLYSHENGFNFITKEIRSFAIDYCDTSSVIAPIADYLLR